jgi:mannose-6-phosphate isomerase
VPLKPAKIEPRFVERIWGTTKLQPWFPDASSKIGEVWFQQNDSPLLVKFLFTSANLSVQVHPDDPYAQQQGHERGKTEMWHILSAQPDSKIAVGLQEPLTDGQLRQCITDNTIDQLLRWVPVQAGDTYLIEAGTIHAIGHGIVLCEIQQNSDVTYRLYDYERNRELHVDHGVAVSDTSLRPDASEFPVTSKYFHAAEFTGGILGRRQDELFIVLSGTGVIGADRYEGAGVWHVPASDEGIQVEIAPGTRALRTHGASRGYRAS